ncbi:MAG: right-handed parallel beta-helix repeat-containing protein, partial [Acidobacteriota bacterium]
MGGIKDALIKRNVIAFSGGAGVGFSASSNSTGVSILENSIHSNQGLGIDLARPGVNPNDDGDSDAGANNGQNFPELHLVTGNEITWSLDSPAGTYLIEFFSNSECDDSNSLDDAADADLNDPICSTGGEVEDDLGSKSPKCTLRAAIQQANANSGTDRIEFKVPSREFDDGLLVVSPATALPAIQEAVTIDAYSQTGSGQGASRIPVVVLDGRSVAGSGGVHGFTITGSNSEITGFVIQGFSGYGISISGPGGNRITGNLIGTDADGQTAVPNQAGGIEIDNSPSNTIGGTATLSDRPLPFEMPYFESNVISGNTASGIVIGGPDSTENSVLGNLIGPTSGFEAGSGNRNGILVLGGANSNTIGPGNTISANTRDGVLINTGARENRIVDNAIGIEISRLGNTVPLGNGKNGVHIDGAPANTIGGLTTANRNIISANAGCGIVIEHGATQNKVLGNFIGTDHQGTFAVPNGDPEDPSEDVGHGILLDDAPANQIGGLEEGATNVISGNFVFGVAIRGTLSEENVVQGNHIGLSVDGYAPVYRADLRTQKGGILIGSENAFTDKGAPRNTIGGEDPAARNLLSGNHAEGLSINGQSSTGNKVQGNYIGVDISGQAAVVLPVTSESGVPRQFVGLHIYDSPGNIIGGGSFPESGCVSPCNVISGNDFIGVEISGSSTGNEVLGNVVGTVADGTAVLPDPGDNHPQRIGIELGNATSNSRIGKAGQGNLISGNRYEGIGIWETTSNRIEGNRIGTDRTGTAPIGNGTGIDIGGSSDNRIGGSSVADGNLIAWNRIGVEISEGDGNSIRFNSIFENDESGIRLSGGNQGSILPNVLSASSGGRIWGGFFRSPSTTGVLDFYSNPSCPGPAACLRQGRTYLGSLPFQAGATRFDFLPPVPLTAGQQVTATTTDAAHSTSSFSLPVEVRADQDGDGAPDSLPGENENNPRQFSTGGGTSVSLDRTDLKLEGDPNAASPTAPTGIRVREILSIRISTQSTSSRTLISTQALAPGSAVTLTVNLADGVEATTWYNFGPTPDDPTEHWYEFLFDGTTGAEILEDRILLHFLDGARGDHDLAANGTIETFGGPSTIADLYFPYLPADPATFVGLAVSNFSDRPASLTFRALGGSGIELDVPDNPASQVLTPETQLASLATEIFGAASATGRFGWIVLDTDNPRLGSFFQFGDTSRLDGSVAVTEPSRSFRFTRVFEGDSAYRGQPASTQLVVANPGTETASVSFSLKEPGGNSIRTSNRTIAGHGVLSETVSELFGSGASGGYIETQVTNGPEVVGFQTISLRNQNTTMGLAPAVESMSNELFSAQLVSAPGLFTSIKLINSSSQNRTVTLTAMADNGGRFADPVTLTLVPGGSLEEDASALFVSSIPGASSLSPAGDPAVLIGSLRAVSDGPGIVGDVLFGDSTGFQYAAALPLQSIP